jgi:ribonuclease R
VERANTRVIGRLLNENGAWIVVARRQAHRPGHPAGGLAGKAKSGQVVSVELTEQPIALSSSRWAGSIEVLGDIDDPGMEIEIAVRKFGVPHESSRRREEAGGQAARRSARQPTSKTGSTCATCRWSPSTAKTRATSTTPSTANR